MNILKQKQEEVSLRLSEALNHYSMAQIAEAYGCGEANIRQIIKSLAKPDSKVGFPVIRKLTQALNKLDKEEQGE